MKRPDDKDFKHAWIALTAEYHNSLVFFMGVEKRPWKRPFGIVNGEICEEERGVWLRTNVEFEDGKTSKGALLIPWYEIKGIYIFDDAADNETARKLGFGKQ